MRKIRHMLFAFMVGFGVIVNGLYAQSENVIRSLIESLQAGEPVYYENLTIIPVYATEVKDSTYYTTLDTALKNDFLTITEMEGGQVPEVKLTNNSDKYIYIMGGEILTGCKQDRIIGRDVLIGPSRKNIAVPVYCVEQGRWTYQSDNFYSKENLGLPKLRAEAQRAESSAQSAIWGHISDLNRKMGISTDSGAYQAAYEKEDVKEKISAIERQLKDILQMYEDTVGVVVGVGTAVGIAAHAVSTNIRKRKLIQEEIKSSNQPEKKGGA